jgi:hypothetical protein
MKRPAIVFTHTGFTVHAARHGDHWQGELLDARGEVTDVFAYTREVFPGAVIGALLVRDVAFVPQLASRMWLHTALPEVAQKPNRSHSVRKKRQWNQSSVTRCHK